MRRALLTLVVLPLACLTLPAQDPFAPSVRPKTRPVVVDPLDFRQPIPDPELGVFQQLDDKAVRYTGVLVNAGTEGKAKRPWVELQTDISALIRSRAPGAKLKPGQKPELLTIRVHLENDDTRLRASAAGKYEVTVEGRGQILLGTWALVIHDATVTSVKPAPK